MVTVHAIGDNRVIRVLRPYPFEELRAAFSYTPPGVFYMPAYKRGTWDGTIKMLKYDKVATGLFLAARDEIEKVLGIKFLVEWKLISTRFRKVDGEARDYQYDCINRMQHAAQRGGGLVLSPTGSGKTRMTGLFFKSLIGDGIFIVDELTLMNQARDELEKVIEEHVGVIGNSEFEPRRITVATIQTMHRHRKRKEFIEWTDGAQVMVIDEVHLALNRRQFSVVEQIKPPAVFGLTATLELKKKHIRMRAFALAGPVIFKYSLQEGTQGGYLTGGSVFQLQVKGKQNTSKEWVESYRELVVRSWTRNNAIEETARAALKAGRSVLILVKWVAHLKEISTRLADIKHQLLYGDIDVESRTQAKTGFDAGKIQLLIANDVAKKGLDIKKVDFIIDAAGAKSKNDAIQKFGRGVRLSAGKVGLVYFDIADTGNDFQLSAKSRKRAFREQKISVYSVPFKEGLMARVVARAIQVTERGVKNAGSASPRSSNGDDLGQHTKENGARL